MLKGAGATFPSLLCKRWFTVYYDSHPDTYVKYAAVGSGEGVRRFIGKNVADEEQVDFGASDAAMSDAQLAEASDNVLMVPATAGCVVLAYNLPGLKGELNLSGRPMPASFWAKLLTGMTPSSPSQIPGLSFLSSRLSLPCARMAAELT